MKEESIIKLLESIEETTLQAKINSMLKVHFSNLKSGINYYNMGFITSDECINFITQEVEKTLNRIFKIQMLELKKENREHLEEIIFKNS